MRFSLNDKNNITRYKKIAYDRMPRYLVAVRRTFRLIPKISIDEIAFECDVGEPARIRAIISRNHRIIYARGQKRGGRAGGLYYSRDGETIGGCRNTVC